MERCAVLYSDVEDDPSLLTDNGMGTRAPFHCSECDKSFRYRSDLRRHFARHTELKPFQCPRCTPRTYLTSLKSSWKRPF
uniref:C2H2-type domain-containing protein n=1 Tax=Anolis carolinensis TaxID=28377 RepID=A0A803T5E9_ANOCA